MSDTTPTPTRPAPITPERLARIREYVGVFRADQPRDDLRDLLADRDHLAEENERLRASIQSLRLHSEKILSGDEGLPALRREVEFMALFAGEALKETSNG